MNTQATIKGLTQLSKASFTCIIAFLMLAMVTGCSTEQPTTASIIRAEAAATDQNMYVIERGVPNAGSLSAEDLKKIAIESCDVLEQLGTDIQWLHSYVTDDIIYCVFTAKEEDLIEKHASMGGFPTDGIYQVRNVIDPSTSK